jgi:hypothetical protein
MLKTIRLFFKTPSLNFRVINSRCQGKEKPDSIPSGAAVLSVRREVSIKQALLATVVHHKYLLHADKIHIKKQSMM